MTGMPTSTLASCTSKSWYGDSPACRSATEAVESTITRPRHSSSVVMPAIR